MFHKDKKLTSLIFYWIILPIERYHDYNYVKTNERGIKGRVLNLQSLLICRRPFANTFITENSEQRGWIGYIYSVYGLTNHPISDQANLSGPFVRFKFSWQYCSTQGSQKYSSYGRPLRYLFRLLSGCSHHLSSCCLRFHGGQ